jgi:RNA 3'-terminal phosphate cyclase (ATP)
LTQHFNAKAISIPNLNFTLEMPKKAVQLDGTTLEGGGQLLRLAACLSALTRTPISITRIRGNRSGGGGLKLQHLKAVEWLADACDAAVDGGQVGSRSLSFAPNPHVRESHLQMSPNQLLTTKKPAKSRRLRSEIDITTPGSITLVLQAVLPFLLFTNAANHQPGRPFALTIRGGTNVGQSPSFDYVAHVLVPTLARLGLPAVTATLEKRGWNTGRACVGSARFVVAAPRPGRRLAAFEMRERGEVRSVFAKIIAPPACRRPIADDVRARVADALGAEVGVEVESEDSRDAKRLYLLLVAATANGFRLGRDWLFDERIRNPLDAAARLAKKVVGDLVREVEHGGCVDEFMRDQIVVFRALAEGRCEVDVGRGEDGAHVRPSLHARTAEWVAGQVLGVGVGEDGVKEGCGYAVGDGDGISGEYDVQKVAVSVESLEITQTVA